MRLLLPLLVLTACSSEPTPPAPSPTPAAAPAPAAPAAEAAGHASGEHAHASPHGGMVKTVGQHHVEALFMPGGIMFYVSDSAQNALPVAGFSGTAVIQGPGGVETVTLSPMGDHLHAVAKLAQRDRASAVLTLTSDGKAQSVTFETASVGLAEHDHTSLHGGQVSMWRDYHVEYAAKDGEYRFWLTDAKRVAVAAAASGSVKDGETVLPLTFDAATGMLSAKAEGAGSRPVTVDVKVGEESFSLGFNAGGASAGGHDHGGHAH